MWINNKTFDPMICLLYNYNRFKNVLIYLSCLSYRKKLKQPNQRPIKKTREHLRELQMMVPLIFQEAIQSPPPFTIKLLNKCASQTEQSGQTESVSVLEQAGALCQSGPLNNTQSLKAGSYCWLGDIKKNAPFKALTHTVMVTHTHSKVDKIFQVSGTAPRERGDLQPQKKSNT